MYFPPSLGKISNYLRKECVQRGCVVVCEKQVEAAVLARGGATEGPRSVKP
jgi:hypothetical protein